MGDEVNITIEPLADIHRREAFSCGEEYIDNWCKKTAHKEHGRDRARVFVATETGSADVIGVYSLAVRSLAPQTFLNSGFGRRDVPAIYFATLGVCETHAGRGIGSAMMVDAFKRVIRVADDVGAYCLWLTSVDEEKVKFYQTRQFIRFDTDRLDMYVLTSTLRDAFRPEPQAN